MNNWDKHIVLYTGHMILFSNFILELGNKPMCGFCTNNLCWCFVTDGVGLVVGVYTKTVSIYIVSKFKQG